MDHLSAMLDGDLDNLVAGKVSADRECLLPAFANDVMLRRPLCVLVSKGEVARQARQN